MYALPLPVPSHPTTKSSKKRKRAKHRDEDGTTQDELLPSNPEYSAVITPDERQQRRLAGQPLHESLPAFPFPHAASLQSKRVEPEDHQDGTRDGKPHSLRLQHLGAITAILHRCLEEKDYKRASRALGLLLRTEVNGRTIDLRHGSLWGIGAEILLRNPPNSRNECISRESFERAKLFYDRLALQHPWNRSWPNIVNAQDFKLAMFGLWIYITSQESRAMQSVDEDDSTDAENAVDRELRAKEWEVAEAEKIAREMDTLMGTIPFVDDLELIRLRRMVALWMADLYEAVDGLQEDRRSDRSMQVDDMERAWLGEQSEQDEQDDEPKVLRVNDKALAARNLAKAMSEKLKDGIEDDISSDDELMDDG